MSHKKELQEKLRTCILCKVEKKGCEYRRTNDGDGLQEMCNECRLSFHIKQNSFYDAMIAFLKRAETDSKPQAFVEVEKKEVEVKMEPSPPVKGWFG